MTDSTPPSIPPRLRPTTPTTARPGTTSGAKSSAKSPTAARNGNGRTESASAASTRPAATDEKPSHEPDGVSTPKRDEPPYRATAGVPPRTSTSTAASTSASDEGEQPSPLMVAVDTATVWFKKAAGATSAAFASVTRPRTEDPTMSSPAPAPATSPTAARTSTRPPATGATSQVRPATGRIPTVGGPRRVRLAVSRIDPWSVMKLSFLLSVAIGIMIVVAAAVIWLTLDGLHVFTEANNLVKQITGEESSINILQYVEFRRVVSGATLIAVIDVFLLTALSTIGAFLYNIVAALVGGVHVTMTDE